MNPIPTFDHSSIAAALRHYHIGTGVVVDEERLTRDITPGVHVYDDRGELEMLGRTAWLEVAFGSGWAVHALANKSLANDHVQGLVLENSGRSMDLKREDCRHRVDSFHNIPPGDRVVRVTGHHLRSNTSYLCFDIELHLASGRVIGAAGDNGDWCGAAFEYVCPPGHAVLCPIFRDGRCNGILVMQTTLYEPWTPRTHRLLKAPPAARAIVESCQVATTNGLPADAWCHVLGFLCGYDLLEPVLLPTFSLPETYLHTVDLRSMLASVHRAVREDPESDESEENSYGARSDSFGDYYDADY